MQRSLTTALLLAAGMMLAGDGYAQQTPATSTPAATTPAAPAATTPKAATTAEAPAKKTGTATKGAAAAPLKTQKQKFSYALGMSIGTQVSGNLKKQSVDVDPNLVSLGMKDALSGAKPLLTQEEAQAVLTEVQQAKMQKVAAKNEAEGEAFLAANKSKEGVVTLTSGLQYKILTAGTGPKPTASDSIVCNYRGTFINGTEFDSTEDRGQPASFKVGRIIKGWSEALQLMPVGSKWQLFIPSSLAYGEQGEPRGGIEPNATLLFEVELLSIQDKTKDHQMKDDQSKDDKSDKPEESKQ